MQSVFIYDDYRKYLQDFYRSQKEKNPLYSYKSFSKLAGIQSPNYLALVMEGTRNLTTSNIHQFAQALRLRLDEVEFFEALVLFNQSKSDIEQKYYKRRITYLKKSKPASIQKASSVGLLKQWFSSGIVVLAHGRSFESAVKKCKQELAVRQDLIEKSLREMIEIGFLQIIDGMIRIPSQQITLHDPRALSQAQEIYLQSQLEQSIKAFRAGYKKKKNKFLSHTLTVPKDSIGEIQKEFISMMENLTQKMDQKIVFGEEELCQINIQVFRPILD